MNRGAAREERGLFGFKFPFFPCFLACRVTLSRRVSG